VKPGPEVLGFQARLIDVLAPVTGKDGATDAYVRTEAEPDINAATIEYIEHYAPEHSGENCIAHIAVGLAKLDDLTATEVRTSSP
jgi:hypothetical protein